MNDIEYINEKGFKVGDIVSYLFMPHRNFTIREMKLNPKSGYYDIILDRGVNSINTYVVQPRDIEHNKVYLRIRKLKELGI